MDFPDYKQFWNHKAPDALAAMSAVDGSPDEATLRLTGRYTARQLHAALDWAPTDRVFEIGCGVGRIGLELLPHIGAWTGLDISENMLGVARTRLGHDPRVQLHAVDRPSLAALADGSQDKGYCVAVFIHMDKEDFAHYLHEVARVLRPGGLFYFDHWNLANPVGLRRFSLDFEQARHQPPGVRKDVARNQFSNPEEARLLVEHAGLELVANLEGSPWLHVVVRRPDGDAGALQRERQRVAAAAARVIYSPRWTHYFDLMLTAEREHRAPQDLAAELAAAPGDDLEVAMFRRWVAGNWSRRQAQWGPVPDALARDLGDADAR